MEQMVYFMPNEEILVFTYISQKACRCFPEVKEYVWIWFQFSSLAQSCPTLCDPIDGSPPGSSVPGILQARTLEWVAISFSNA